MRLVVLLALAVAGCRYLPSLQLPQVKQAEQAVKGGGQRYEDYGACQKTATTVGELVACMDRAGYDYIPRSAEAQATECWRLRDVASTDRLPEALCFIKRS